MKNFNEKLESFLDKLQQNNNTYFQTNFPNLELPKIKIDVGKKYIKVLRDGSVHSFICIEDIKCKKRMYKSGDILKANSWTSPSTTTPARGNIFNEDNGLNGVSVYGARYI